MDGHDEADSRFSHMCERAKNSTHCLLQRTFQKTFYNVLILQWETRRIKNDLTLKSNPANYKLQPGTILSV